MRKKDVVTKEDLLNYYEKVRKIKFKDTTIEITSIKDIYDNLVKERKATVYTRGGEHCEKGKMRSFDDLIKIYKYYFQDKNLIDFKKDLQSFIENNKKAKFDYIEKLYYCPNIRKVNFRGWVYYGYDMLNCKFSDSGFPKCNVVLNDYD